MSRLAKFFASQKRTVCGIEGVRGAPCDKGIEDELRLPPYWLLCRSHFSGLDRWISRHKKGFLVRLVALTAAAIVAVAAGVRLEWTGVGALDVAGTVVLIVAAANALRWSDSADGMAAATTTAVMARVFALGAFGSQNALAALAAAMGGACLGFRTYNLPPAAVILAVVGALFLGFLAAVLAIDVRPSIGAGTWVGAFKVIYGSGQLRIGSGCDISCGAQIHAHSAVRRYVSGRRVDVIDRAPVSIGDCVFVGANAVAMMGGSIDDGGVISAGAVVTRDVPSHAVVAGVPARPIGSVVFDLDGVRIEHDAS
jgi:hypothetical protein